MAKQTTKTTRTSSDTEKAFGKLGEALSGKASEATKGVYWRRFTREAAETGSNKLLARAGDIVMFVPRVGLKVMGGIGSIFGKTAGFTAKTSGKGLLWALERPLVGTIQLMTGAVKVVKGHPVPAAVAAGAAALIGGGLWARSQAESRTQQDFINQVQGRTPSYMNSVTPQEYANMQAAMAAGKDGGAGFADAANARAAEGGVQAPAV